MQYMAEIRQHDGIKLGPCVAVIITSDEQDLMKLAVPKVKNYGAQVLAVAVLKVRKGKRGWTQVDCHLRATPPGLVEVVPRRCEMKGVI